MALPYPAMDFTAFDILTAAEMDELVANDQALAAGTGFNTGAIPTAALANGSVINAKLNTTAGELGGSLTTWSPTYSGITVGNGTVVARYQQVGKVIRGYFDFTLGSTSAVGTPAQFSAPVTASSNYSVVNNYIGIARLSAGSNFLGTCRLETTTSIRVLVIGAAGSYANESGITNLVPGTWATGHRIYCQFEYEAA